MKNVTVRIAVFAGAVLVLGTLAFAAAEAVQSPPASQIPTVVTGRAADASEPVPTSASALSTGTLDATPTRTLVPAATGRSSSGDAQDGASSGSDGKTSAGSDREVVTPKVRDDGDGDTKGSGKNDGDADDHSGSSGGGKTPSSTGEKKSSSDGGSGSSSGSSSGGGSIGHKQSSSSGGGEKSTGPSGLSGSSPQSEKSTRTAQSLQRFASPTRTITQPAASESKTPVSLASGKN